MDIGKLLKRKNRVSVSAGTGTPTPQPISFAERLSRLADRMENDPDDPLNNPELVRRNSANLLRLLDQMAEDDPRVAAALAHRRQRSVT